MGVEITGRVVTGPFVVVERTLDFGTHREPGVAIYRIEDSLVREIRFLREGDAAERVTLDP